MTNQAKHTPGPWKIRHFAGDLGKDEPQIATLPDSDGFGRPIATVNYLGADERQANAALIASAPDLLAERDRLRQVNAELVAALEDAAFLLAKIGKFPGDLPQFMGSIIRSVQDARAALAKAKGE